MDKFGDINPQRTPEVEPLTEKRAADPLERLADDPVTRLSQPRPQQAARKPDGDQPATVQLR